MKLIINTTSDATTPEYCYRHTMTVAELIRVLGDYDGDTPVIINRGCTYGRIAEELIEEVEG